MSEKFKQTHDYKKAMEEFRKAKPEELYKVYENVLERTAAQKREIVNAAFIHYISTPEGQSKLNKAVEHEEQRASQQQAETVQRAQLSSQQWQSRIQKIGKTLEVYEQLANMLMYSRDVPTEVFVATSNCESQVKQLQKLSSQYDRVIQTAVKDGNQDEVARLMQERDVVLGEATSQLLNTSLAIRGELEKGLKSYVQRTSAGDLMLMGGEHAVGGIVKGATEDIAKKAAKSLVKAIVKMGVSAGVALGKGAVYGEVEKPTSAAERTLSKARKKEFGEGLNLPKELIEQYKKKAEEDERSFVLSGTVGVIRDAATLIDNIINAGERAKNAMNSLDRELGTGGGTQGIPGVM
ncbi:MAG: hypothetical protein ACP5H8_01890 [Candidatus Micrarchaeia archaeon]